MRGMLVGESVRGISGMIDNLEDYERFVYKDDPTQDFGPPHGIWDRAKKEWAEGGTFSTQEYATAYAAGMNKAREMFKRTDRVLTGLSYDLKRAIRSLEDLGVPR